MLRTGSRSAKIALVGCFWMTTVMGQGDELFHGYPMSGSIADPVAAYRWRPPETTSPSITAKPAGMPTLSGENESLPSYLQAPLGLPRGTYRPLETLPTLSPSVGVYRFRSISPEEQLRLMKPNEYTNREKAANSLGEIRFREAESETTFWSPDARFQHRFRPDERLSRDSHRHSGSTSPIIPTLGPAQSYAYPQFRRQNQDR